jgi:hypothetical protein
MDLNNEDSYLSRSFQWKWSADQLGLIGLTKMLSRRKYETSPAQTSVCIDMTVWLISLH